MRIAESTLPASAAMRLATGQLLFVLALLGIGIKGKLLLFSMCLLPLLFVSKLSSCNHMYDIYHPYRAAPCRWQ